MTTQLGFGSRHAIVNYSKTKFNKVDPEQLGPLTTFCNNCYAKYIPGYKFDFTPSTITADSYSDFNKAVISFSIKRNEASFFSNHTFDIEIVCYKYL